MIHEQESFHPKESISGFTPEQQGKMLEYLNAMTTEDFRNFLEPMLLEKEKEELTPIDIDLIRGMAVRWVENNRNMIQEPADAIAMAFDARNVAKEKLGNLRPMEAVVGQGGNVVTTGPDVPTTMRKAARLEGKDVA